MAAVAWGPKFIVQGVTVRGGHYAGIEINFPDEIEQVVGINDVLNHVCADDKGKAALWNPPEITLFPGSIRVFFPEKAQGRFNFKPQGFSPAKEFHCLVSGATPDIKHPPPLMDLCRMPVDGLLVTLRALVTVNILLKGKPRLTGSIWMIILQVNLAPMAVSLKDMPGLASRAVTGILHFGQSIQTAIKEIKDRSNQ